MPSMIRSRLQMVATLSAEDTPSVLTVAMLRRMAGERAPNRVIADLVDANLLRRAMQGLYFNTTKPYEIAEILPYVVPHGVLSLASVLGEEGMLNNPTAYLMVVAPLTSTFSRDHRTLDDGTQIRLHHLPPRLFGFGVLAPRGYNRAEPERALADWLYLDRSGKSKIGPVPDDLEIDRINVRKLRGYSKRMGIEDHRIDNLLDRVEAARAATDHSPF